MYSLVFYIYYTKHKKDFDYFFKQRIDIVMKEKKENTADVMGGIPLKDAEEAGLVENDFDQAHAPKQEEE